MTPSIIPTVLSPPPVQTPITASGPDQLGMPFDQRGVARGDVNTVWAQWFNAVYQSFIGGIGGANLPSDIHAIPNIANTFTPFLSGGFMQTALFVANSTIEPPSPILPGECFIITTKQDATGARTLTWNAFYQGTAAVTYKTTANSETYWFFQIRADGTAADLLFAGGASGLAIYLLVGAAAGGDLNGTYPNPGVVKVNGAAVPVSKPTLGSNSAGQLVAGAAGDVTVTSGTLNTGFLVIGTGGTGVESGVVTPGAIIGLIIIQTTVSALPPSPPAGTTWIYSVSDALTPVAGAPVVGGGASVALVGWGASQWTVIAVLP